MADQPTVYVVDDDEAVSLSVRAVLGRQRYLVRCFSSAEQFLSSVSTDTPGCLVTDVQMPGASGLELQRHLRAAGSPLALVVVTGVVDPPTAESLREEGVVLLEKPYNPADLLRAVADGLAASQERWRRGQQQ